MGFTTGFGLHSQATRLCESASWSGWQPPPTGFSPSPDAPFQGTWARPATEDASLDYNSPMTLIGDFQVGLFPLRSPLLGESWLVSSPPPTDMLKLSGWSCLNSGRTLGVSLLRLGHGSLSKPTAACDYSIRTAAYQTGGLHLSSRKKRGASLPGPLCCSRPESERPDDQVRAPFERKGAANVGQPTLRQACSRPRPRAQYAFKNSMIHGILQFTLRIAFRCVLHRYGSQDIRC